jgi:hypothetical protein
VSIQTFSPPRRSREQKLAALEIANQVRRDRSALKRELKAGRACAASILDDPPDWLATMKVIDLVIALPKVGRVKAAKALGAAGVSTSKTLGGITSRQRRQLVEALGGRANGNGNGLGYGPPTATVTRHRPVGDVRSGTPFDRALTGNGGCGGGKG